jgi:glucokinase
LSDVTIFGLDIGGTKCAVARTDEDGVPRELARIATSTPADTLAALYAAIERSGVDGDAVFGVSCGSPLDARTGVILSPPNLPGWDRVRIVEDLVRRFGGEAYLMNDANAGALAEWTYGAAVGCRNVVFLTFGTGMGAGLILDGRLFEGASGHAGEVGHLRLADDGPVGYGKAGSFEGLCSGGGIAQLARDAAQERDGRVAFHPGSIDDITAWHVAQAAEHGDATARSLFAAVGESLGRGLAVLVDVLNPEIIVLGSIYVRCREFIEPAMQQALEREALPQALRDCRVVPAALGEALGNYAAVTVARYRRGETGS